MTPDPTTEKAATASRWRMWAAMALLAGTAWGLGMLVGHEQGYQARQAEVATRPARSAPPRVDRQDRTGGAPTGAGDMQATVVEALQALGYVDGLVSADGPRGVVDHAPARTQPGFNLLVGANRPEAILMSLDGTRRHSWSLSFKEAFPDQPADPEAVGRRYWRRVNLLPDGGLIAIYEGQGLVRIDHESNLVWAAFNHAHHHARVLADGQVLVLVREFGQKDGFHPTRPIVEDHLVWMDLATGEERRRVSIVDALVASRYRRLLDRSWTAGDVLHTNTVQVLDGRHAGRHPAMAAGHILLTLPNIDTLAVLDPTARGGKGEIVWTMVHGWRFPHEGTLLDSGQLMIFDNQGNQSLSRIEIFDPASHTVTWRYDGSPENGFYTEICGAVHQLDNGNLLITESQDGRAFELTPDKEIVWDYRWDEWSADDPGLVAMLFDVQRIAADHPGLSFLGGRGLDDQGSRSRQSTAPGR
ncbi:MAG: arylsulfotransferase family protein [Myxococcota bacterium]|nr:arylsulfotransferase family protein [Myxococcota bacterium]